MFYKHELFRCQDCEDLFWKTFYDTDTHIYITIYTPIDNVITEKLAFSVIYFFPHTDWKLYLCISTEQKIYFNLEDIFLFDSVCGQRNQQWIAMLHFSKLNVIQILMNKIHQAKLWPSSQQFWNISMSIFLFFKRIDIWAMLDNSNLNLDKYIYPT